MNFRNVRPCGDFRVSYKKDMSMFEDKSSFILTVIGILILTASPLFFDSHIIFLLINIGFYAIAALGLISAFTIVLSTILSEVTVLLGSFFILVSAMR